jgi:L-rhamnose mutarotase
MTWRVDVSHWQEYRDIHLNPWPELLSLIQEHGIHNYSIFAFPQDQTDGSRRVFAYMEVDGDSPAEALDALAQTELKQKWDAEVTVWVLPQAIEGSSVQFLEMEQFFFCP